MVTLYVAGRKVAWADAEKLFADEDQMPRAEFRNDAGEVVGLIIPKSVAPDDPDWVKAITPEEIARRQAEPGYTFDEVKKRLGWE